MSRFIQSLFKWIAHRTKWKLAHLVALLFLAGLNGVLSTFALEGQVVFTVKPRFTDTRLKLTHLIITDSF